MTSVMFRSKLDVWLVLVIVGGFASVGVAPAVASASWVALVVAAPCAALGAGFAAWLYRSTSYTFSESELWVRSSGFSWRVPLRAIRAVTPTHNPLSSPALSLDRLRIDYGSSESIMVSPADRELFLQELERRRASA
jgi:hypothetical protein